MFLPGNHYSGGSTGDATKESRVLPRVVPPVHVCFCHRHPPCHPQLHPPILPGVTSAQVSDGAGGVAVLPPWPRLLTGGSTGGAAPRGQPVGVTWVVREVCAANAQLSSGMSPLYRLRLRVAFASARCQLRKSRDILNRGWPRTPGRAPGETVVSCKVGMYPGSYPRIVARYPSWPVAHPWSNPG